MSLDPSYEIKYERKFERYVTKNLPKHLKEVLDQKLKYFSENPHHPSLNTKPYTISPKIKKQLGIDEVYEFYVNRKDYRVLVYVLHQTKELVIWFIGNHNEIERFVKNS